MTTPTYAALRMALVALVSERPAVCSAEDRTWIATRLAEGWTEERHAAFLDRMELSFVQQVLGGSDVRQASRRLGRRPAPQTEGGSGQLVPAPLRSRAR